MSVMLLFSLTVLTAQTTCDPPSPTKKLGRCTIINWPDGDTAVCNDVSATGSYCGYGTLTQN